MSKEGGEIKGLIIVITFLSTFFIVTSFIPSGFKYVIPENREVDVPQYFEAIDVQSFGSTEYFTLNYSLDNYHFTIGGYDLMLFIGYPFGSEIRIDHFHYWWIFQYGFHSMKWYDADGLHVSYEHPLYHEILPISALDDHEYGERYTMKCEHFQSIVVFGYNQTAYDSHVEAFQDEALTIFFGVEFDQLQTTYNVWNLVAMILFFQMPNVHPAINALIAIPIWILVAYLVYVLILKAIPFVGG